MAIPTKTLLIVGGVAVAGYFVWKMLEESKKKTDAAIAAYAAGTATKVAETKKGITVQFTWKGITTQATIPLSGAFGAPYAPTLAPEQLRRMPPAPTRSVPTTFAVGPLSRGTLEYPFAKKGRPLERILGQVR